jgi:hypothetical protein
VKTLAKMSVAALRAELTKLNNELSARYTAEQRKANEKLVGKCFAHTKVSGVRTWRAYTQVIAVNTDGDALALTFETIPASEVVAEKVIVAFDDVFEHSVGYHEPIGLNEFCLRWSQVLTQLSAVRVLL